MDSSDSLARKLQASKGDWTQTQLIFSSHVASGFLEGFLMGELDALGRDPRHVVPKSVGKSSFTFFNDENFEYSVRIVGPFRARPHTVKWLGVHQIIAVRGPGALTLRRLEVPSTIDGSCFEPGIALEEIEHVTANAADIIATENANQLLDISSASGAVIVESLTHRKLESGLIWTFDSDLKSLFSEQSSLTLSRLRNVFQLAHATRTPVSDDIYALALDPSRPQIALLAIHSMLLIGHADAFLHLQRAMDSDSPQLSQGAQSLFESVELARRGRTHAA